MEHNFEDYTSFLNRIFSFQNPNFSFYVDNFVPSESVKSKVSYDGKFTQFIGDTVVFDLSDYEKSHIFSYYIKPLYEIASSCLAEQLNEHTIHMTLHDLNASAQTDFDVLERIFNTEISMAKLLSACGFKTQNIKMETTCVFNMVNTSIVLGLKPKTDEDYKKIMELYGHIDGVKSLPYPFTPHITLAYYNQSGFYGEQLRKLEEIINSLNRESFEIELSTDKLYYQKFISMNEYFNIMCFVN